MKKRAFAFAAASIFAVAFPMGAQQSPTQPVTIQMACRDMATTGNYLAPNETIISNKACHAVSVKRIGETAAKSDPQPAAMPPEAPRPSVAPTPEQPYAPSVLSVATPDDKFIRAVVMESASWQARDGWNGKDDKSAGPGTRANGSSKDAANAKSQTDDLIMNFNHECPQVVVTDNFAKAGFAVTAEHEGKGHFGGREKIVVFNRDGDDIFSASARGTNESLKGACDAILAAVNK